MIAGVLCFLVKLLAGAQARWEGFTPDSSPRLYFANHTSNLDFVMVWSALPPEVRRLTRPVAARDYWSQGPVRPYLAQRVFRAMLIERKRVTRSENPIPVLAATLRGGDSLIIFPEGRRNPGQGLLPFKSGLYHIARLVPGLEMVPVYIDNLNRVLPRGEILPIPLICSVAFGRPLQLQSGEKRPDFLDRARIALEALMAK